MEIRMELREIQMVDDPMRSQVVVLGEVGGDRVFPIYIGHYEAMHLNMALRKEKQERPFTHDLVLNVIEEMGGRLERIIVDDLRNGTFYGKLAVRIGAGEEILVDSRPSDALIVATKMEAPVFVDDGVLAEIQRETEDQE